MGKTLPLVHPNFVLLVSDSLAESWGAWVSLGIRRSWPSRKDAREMARYSSAFQTKPWRWVLLVRRTELTCPSLRAVRSCGGVMGSTGQVSLRPGASAWQSCQAPAGTAGTRPGLFPANPYRGAGLQSVYLTERCKGPAFLRDDFQEQESSLMCCVARLGMERPVPRDWMGSLLSPIGKGKWCSASCSLLKKAILAVSFFFFFHEKLLLFLHFQLPGIIFFD